MVDLNGLLKIPDAAMRCGCSEAQLWNLVSEGRLKAIWLGGAVYVREDDLEFFLKRPRPHVA